MQPRLSHSTLVPREHVHRDALSEVYLTDIVCDRYPNFRVGVHLPKSHSYYSDHLRPAADRYDPLLVLECFRQASILIAHRHVGVEFDQSFVFNAATVTVVSDDAMTVTSSPGNGELSAVIVGEKVRDDTTIGITLDMTVSLNGMAAVTMTMSIQWMPKRVWARVRASGRAKLGLAEYRSGIEPQPGRHPHRSVGARQPEALGRGLSRNVVVGAARHVAAGFEVDVIVDQHHPSLFDHPLDHIPGAVIFEAVRQAGIVGADEYFGLSPRRLRIRSLSATFTRFGELDLPTSALVRPHTDTCEAVVGFDVDIMQEGVSIASCGVLFARSHARAHVAVGR
ncbi:AfsA-related hotdog domain-containing protein [Williamsia sp. SKLECPSW1]